MKADTRCTNGYYIFNVIMSNYLKILLNMYASNISIAIQSKINFY